jgi:hypothetical protein
MQSERAKGKSKIPSRKTGKQENRKKIQNKK